MSTEIEAKQKVTITEVSFDKNKSNFKLFSNNNYLINFNFFKSKKNMKNRNYRKFGW